MKACFWLPRRHCRIAVMPVNDASTVAGRPSRGRSAAGPVAQWLEPAAHNGLVAGSSPAGPTSKSMAYEGFIIAVGVGGSGSRSAGRVRVSEIMNFVVEALMPRNTPMVRRLALQSFDQSSVHQKSIQAIGLTPSFTTVEESFAPLKDRPLLREARIERNPCRL